MTECTRCNGTGRTNIGVSQDDIIMPDGKIVCPTCEGDGSEEEE